MAKLQIAQRIYEPDESATHYGPPPSVDQVTLCGIPDWLGGRTPGEVTDRPVNCFLCLQIVKHVKATRFD